MGRKEGSDPGFSDISELAALRNITVSGRSFVCNFESAHSTEVFGESAKAPAKDLPQ
jgi:hypothetical protein